MNDGNGEDTDPESPLGFSLLNLPFLDIETRGMSQDLQWIKENQRWLLLSGKLPVKRTRSVRARTLSNFPASPATPSEQHAVVQSTVAKAPAPTPVTKSAPPPSRPPQLLLHSLLLKFSRELCCRYFLEPFMVPRPFFYPRIIQEFYRTMTNRGVYPPSVIYFEIDGRQGMLNSEMVARDLNIPFTPPNLVEFQPITRN
ncbi:hypothetical protein CK203_059640 [Vitis vinifera]|uniref:Uncharacterized protein n=1 Tax=Vitis vinifera TaxID=29760 RepID=A0A438H0J1_VITVI|nr:hypothetical protein CK203_059640 [Vitis vinifera]